MPLVCFWFGRVDRVLEGLGNVPTAFVASGYSLVDAVSVSGLAGFLDAPMLLTPTDRLHGGVADFIEAEDIEHAERCAGTFGG